MRASTIIAVAASTLAGAVPVTRDASLPGTFEVTNFSFGCTASCYYSFDVVVSGSADHHPDFTTPVKCSGGLDENTDYTECGTVSQTQSVLAYIEKDTSLLKLKYVTQDLSNGATYSYLGEKEVYSATGPNADKQSADFCVPETTAFGVL